MTDPSELRMNVAALKRVDPYAKDILETATHVALYLFISEANEWEKTEIEGALFIYSRIGEPYNSFLIMNRLSTNNQVEPVTEALEVQCQEPFLLYKNGKGIIYGIWFYDKDECIRVASMLTKLAKESFQDTPNKSTPKNKKQPQSVQKKSNVDIFSMLSKAQEDFNSNKCNNVIKGSKVMEPKSPMSNAISELSGVLSATAPDVTSKSVMDFFAKAKVSNTGQYNSGEHQDSSNAVNEGKPLLARLMSHPAAHTVEHIEKQQRSTTPQPTPSQSGMIPVNNQSCENSILSKLQKCKMPTKNSNTVGHLYNQEYSGLNLSTCSGAMNRSEISTIPAEESNSSGFLRIQSPVATPSKMNNQHKNSTNLENAFDKLFRAGSPVTAAENVYQHNSTACDDLYAPLTPKSSTAGNDTAPALIPPGMFAAPSPAADLLNRPIEPLTRNQLLQAFSYLLRTDPEFVNKLHEAYVKSFSEILS
ncbi:mRNA-decapping enzyme 1A [Copidosoma floridanum]|uniref:mRNA-decapping enzyme 1A n=1 Tax=Copidosoma floridanum TaxID=29053 RepID=UPI0006C99E11|nr:mRNA-decapping enzyme 1A [Copidosoma floridanum]